MSELHKLVAGYASRCSDDELFDTLKLHEGYEDNEVNEAMKNALRAEIDRRGLKSGGVL